MNTLNWKILKLVLNVLLMTTSLNAGDAGVVNPKAVGVPFVSILTAPEKFKGKCVRVYGLLEEDSRNFVLWGSSESADMGDSSSMLRVGINFDVLKATPADVAKLSGAYVVVEGVLDYTVSADGAVIYPLGLSDARRLGFRGRPLRRDDLLKRLHIDPINGDSQPPNKKMDK
jgi:hypothetical protein